MSDILNGPKSHDLQHHLVEDVVHHGNPAGFDCSAGESKMRVQKLKNTFSNKSAPSVDVARKIMRTEVVKHILDGGVLNADGTLYAHQNVLQEANRTRSFRIILGTEASSRTINYGGVSLNDWKVVQGRKVKNKSYPPNHHVNLGIPNVKMITCRKIQTSTGPLFRNGGFILMKDGEFQLYFLHQIYKDDDGYSVAVAEVMRDVSTSFPDAFLREMEIRTWKKSGRFLLLDNFQQVDFPLQT